MKNAPIGPRLAEPWVQVTVNPTFNPDCVKARGQLTPRSQKIFKFRFIQQSRQSQVHVTRTG